MEPVSPVTVTTEDTLRVSSKIPGDHTKLVSGQLAVSCWVTLLSLACCLFTELTWSPDGVVDDPEHIIHAEQLENFYRYFHLAIQLH